MLAALLVISAPMSGALAATNVGGAAVVVNEVTGTVEGATRTITSNAPVYQNEILMTGAGSSTEVQFLDGSILTVGENSQIELTDMVFDPNPALGSMVLTMTTGVMSFVTGELDSGAYLVNTPGATIGVRGTVFTVAVINGVTTVTVTTGTVTVTTITGTVVTLGPGMTATVSATGAVSGVSAGASVTAAAAGGASTASAAAAASAAAGGLGTGAVVGLGVAGLAVVGAAVAVSTSEEDAESTISTTTTTTTTQ